NSTYQYLYQVEDILNETTSTGLQGALSEFYDAFQELSKAPEKDSNRTVALKKAEALATAINNRYNQLESKKEDAQKELSNDVLQINDMLDQINELNKQISRVSAIGMQPNDLLDSRDYLIDQLSEKFGVKIDKDNNNTINLSVGENAEKYPSAKINNLVNSDPNNKNYTRFSYVENATFDKTSGKITVVYSVLGDKNNQKSFTIDGDQKTADALMQNRILVGDDKGIVGKKNASGVTENYTNVADLKKAIFGSEIGVTKGSIAGNQQVQSTIQGYMDELDKFAASFAYTVNAIQTGTTGATGDTPPASLSGAELLFVIKNADGTLSYTDTGITAKNITINNKIEGNLSLLNCGEKQVDDYSGEKDGTRALAIAQIKNLKINIGSLEASDLASRDKFFTSTDSSGNIKSGVFFENDGKKMNLTSKDASGTKLSDYYASTISKLATATSTSKTSLVTQSILLTNLENQRTSESGVSLDEEMSDLIQFQHSYQANAKMISTVDELLDVVINGLKR
ncbi:MAG: flagellar basal body rod C-terminal domain-containing protein, partial [Clostridiaceae bacterium]|nr:flagellar basal body rod C-terminal domain-containing protein [Clostridiaceae bacterium]